MSITSCVPAGSLHLVLTRDVFNLVNEVTYMFKLLQEQAKADNLQQSANKLTNGLGSLIY